MKSAILNKEEYVTLHKTAGVIRTENPQNKDWHLFPYYTHGKHTKFKKLERSLGKKRSTTLSYSVTEKLLQDTYFDNQLTK